VTITSYLDISTAIIVKLCVLQFKNTVSGIHIELILVIAKDCY